MWEKVQETVNFLKKRGFQTPDYGIVLGTGLGNFSNEIDVKVRISYEDIPNFPKSTVKGHKGEFIYGKLEGKSVVAMSGRFHFYEGYSAKELTFPIRVIKFLGANNLIVSNAVGGVNPKYKVGDIMIIKDHINMLPDHPLRGFNDERFGPRFVDMHEPYSIEMMEFMESIALKNKIFLHKGIYLVLQGPTFETPAEYKMVSLMGADVVGMSTVPEIIVARHMNMVCLGLSVITDLGVEGRIEEVSHEEVQRVAKIAEKKLGVLVKQFIENY
ncbi:purine-nucleoside phosphorylase [Urechidicola croceus]|uniref:Purine nucleoside phosphorylase n=1 Tax=Urechidicola croceus TaxID=1850246 RepID=A0A1D8P6T6_9FLAO|nr:purine-nucleoside phosphorylase [Urechidicola croceus]AOW20276.1 purine-nucleoside phosphorylase [Urechidicola croceus]